MSGCYKKPERPIRLNTDRDNELYESGPYLEDSFEHFEEISARDFDEASREAHGANGGGVLDQ